MRDEYMPKNPKFFGIYFYKPINIVDALVEICGKV